MLPRVELEYGIMEAPIEDGKDAALSWAIILTALHVGTGTTLAVEVEFSGVPNNNAVQAVVKCVGYFCCATFCCAAMVNLQSKRSRQCGKRD